MKENLLAAPGWIDVHKIGQLEGFTHQSSLTCVAEMVPGHTLIDDINNMLQKESDICFGISPLVGHGFTMRILGYKAEQLYNLHNLVANHIVASQSMKPFIKTTAYAK